MKVKILVIGLLLLSIKANSQIIDRITVSTGFSYSNLSWIYEEGSSFHPMGEMEYPPLIGYFNKIDFEYFNKKYFNLMSGVGFYQKGSRFLVGRFDLHLNYLAFDTMLKMKYKIKGFTPHFVIGPRLDYLLNYSSQFNEYDREAVLNKMNYGFKYGLGLQYDFRKFDLGVGWQKNINFNPIVVNDGERLRPKFEIEDKTMVFFLNLGFKLSGN